MNQKEMIKEGFIFAPCANPACDVRFASGILCSICEAEPARGE